MELRTVHTINDNNAYHNHKCYTINHFGALAHCYAKVAVSMAVQYYYVKGVN